VFPRRFRLPGFLAAGLAALLLAPSAPPAAAEPVWPAGYDPARLPGATDYFLLRAGLEHARVRFAAGGTARVAFLGGSITAMTGWRERVMADLRRRFPRTEFDFIAAGIGSLGSVPHAFRFSRDVLARGEVDLLFVEAAVNDASNIPNQPARMLRGMEGVVRQARLANPRMGIIHLHFAMPEHLEAYRAGKVPEVIRQHARVMGIIHLHFAMPEHLEAYGAGRIPEVIRQHERVAAAYGNPSLDLARELTERIAAGQFSWEKDIRNLHPSPFGHAVYAAAIGRLLDAAWAVAREPPVPRRRCPQRRWTLRATSAGGWSTPRPRGWSAASASIPRGARPTARRGARASPACRRWSAAARARRLHLPSRAPPRASSSPWGRTPRASR